MSDTKPAYTPNEDALARAEAAFKRACERIADFEQPEGEGWALFNIPDNPTRPEDFLSMGIEADFDAGRFENDHDAYLFVLMADSHQHSLAYELHGMADIIRLALWGDTDRRTPPEPVDAVDTDISPEHLDLWIKEARECANTRSGVFHRDYLLTALNKLKALSDSRKKPEPSAPAGNMVVEEDENLADWLNEARAHAQDMPAVIQRDYLFSATDKLEKNAVILARVNTLYDAIAHGDEDHRGWLKEAIANHMAGEDVPAPRGKGGKVYSGADAPIRPSNILSGPTPDLPPIMIICEEMDEAELEDLDDEDVDEVEVYYLRVKQEDGKIARIDFPEHIGAVTSIEEAAIAARSIGYEPTHYISNGYGPWLISKMG